MSLAKVIFELTGGERVQIQREKDGSLSINDPDRAWADSYYLAEPQAYQLAKWILDEKVREMEPEKR